MKVLKNRINNFIEHKINKSNDAIYAYIKKEFFSNLSINSKEHGITDEKLNEKNIIISLTTYDKRIFNVYLAIESIMQQTVKPNKIILWLSEDFKNVNLPITLLNQQNRGLTINYCKDILSYKKLIPTLKLYNDSIIITIDDDIIYNYDFIENLINAHKNNPNNIYCYRMHRMKLTKNLLLDKYINWNWDYKGLDISPFNFPTGIGGILYPPNCFTDEVLNEDMFTKICKYADDVWFKAMSLLNNVQSQKIYTPNNLLIDIPMNNEDNNLSLMTINVNKGQNDIQLKAVFDKYNLYEKLY